MTNPIDIIQNGVYDTLNDETFTFNGDTYTINVYKTVPESAIKPYLHLSAGGFGSQGTKLYTMYNVEHTLKLVADYKALAREMLNKVLELWPARGRLSLSGASHVINELINSSENREMINGQEVFTIELQIRSLIK
jgi:hypothetical protein